MISARAFDFRLCQNDERPQSDQLCGLPDQIHIRMNPVSTQFIKTLRLKVKPSAYAWLNSAAREVNTVWNWANETSEKAVSRFSGKAQWLSGFDLNNLSAGATEHFEYIGADTIQRIDCEYASKRRAAKKVRLNWRKSGGARKSLGWVPFKAPNLKRKGGGLRFCGKSIRVFERELLEGVQWRDGCFAQDAMGDWWLCLPIICEAVADVAPLEQVGIDLGLKATATTSDGETLAAGRFYRDAEQKIAQAQRRGHKRQAKRLHRQAKRRRADALHKFTSSIVKRYQYIVVGDVSSSKLAKTNMAKSVLDSGWGMLKTQLQYKGQQAGRSVQVVNESYTTKACSSCGALSGPTGLDMLSVRAWTCCECGDSHLRDVNASRNIAMLGARHRALSAGTLSACGGPARRRVVA